MAGVDDSAKTKLDALKPSRAIGELEALVAAYAPDRNCRIQVAFGKRSSPLTSLAAELGRARRRAELEKRMDVAQAELDRIAAPKQANSDAAALAGYFAALGLNVQTDAINRLLVLLAVLIIECRGGLALAVGLSLSERSPITAEFAPVRACSRKAVGDKLVAAPRERGGPVHSSIRQLARQLEATPTLHTVAGELIAAGVVSVIAGRRGSVFRLLAT